jgi:hypothetical protein
LRILHNTFGMRKFDLRWVSHALDTNWKAETIALSHEILSILQSIRSTGFQSVITEDESYFVLYYPRDSIFDMGVVTKWSARNSQSTNWQKSV